MMVPTKNFCTFADSRMWRSLVRVKKQVKDSHYFDAIFVNNEMNLEQPFKEQFKDKLIHGSRGYGYWVWKPQIILQTMEQLREGDLLLYMDAGCHFNNHGINRLDYYFDKLLDSSCGILAFQALKEAEDPILHNINWVESAWTKGDIFDYFNVRDDCSFYNTGQVIGGILFLVVCNESKRIIKNQLSIFEHHWNFVDDSPSCSPNFSNFVQNRHDQSIFSIIAKKEKIPTISVSEVFQKPDWHLLRNYPILAKADKDMGFFMNLEGKIKRKIGGFFKFR